MAAQGRGPDRTLVHMSPKEVQGLQALAMAHGGSLTINPETGLPEAGFLENILPAVAGFALDAFLPGAGEALGGMFGLEGAAASQLGSALTVGGISGLASGSLEKGIMAGMGAYGGAGLSQSLGNMGAGVNARAVNAEYDTSMPNLTDTERVAAIQAASKPDIGTGFSAAAKAPMDFLKDNKMSLAMLAAPILMDSFGNKDSGPEANPSPGYIRTMKRDPVTGRIYQESAIPTGEFGNRSVGTYGGVPARGMADGGEVMNPMTEEQRINSIATETNNPENMQVAYDTRTDSQKALDYLMGKPGSTNPMMFTRPVNTGAIKPADMLTRTGGHYVLDAATNTYIWIPDAAPASSTGIAGLAERMGGGGDGGRTGSTNDNGYNPSITGLSVDKNGKVVSTNNTLLGFASYLPIVGNFFRAHQQEKQAEADAANVAVDSAGKNAAMAVNPMSRDPQQMAAAANAARGDGLGTPTGSSPSSPSGDGSGGPGSGGGYGPGSVGEGGGPGSTGTGSGLGSGNVGPTCFVKGVLVTLANGKQVAIEDVEVGDVVLGQNGDNQVIAHDRPQLIIPDVRDGTLYGFNGGDKFITSEHPVMTKDGWKAIDQDKAKKFEPHLSEILVGNLAVGDEILILDGSYLTLDSIETYKDQPQQQLYNLMLDGDHTYYVNGLLVHNKGGFYANGGIAALAGGGLGSLGGYSDGGQLLKGPGDGVSDSIPARIGRNQPARLADGEFVIPARIVSELGNGSTNAGAKQLYKMLDRIQANRKKTVGKNKTATDSKSARYLPA